ncbi:MAG: hypothetical protein H6669_07325 [Ardenticatenaceae bacterium]|nr:hypothetical protein [Ardenticatenaceae bacterium]
MTRIDTHFDTNLANVLVSREVHNKHIFQPNTYLHKWWARRCGSTFRLILKHLADEETGYYDGGGLEGQVILDPMMGGGTSLHEAIRLGANVIGCDIEPVPVLQARASLTEVPLSVLEDAFQDFYEVVRQDVSPYFVTTCRQCDEAACIRHVLYGVRRSCRCRTVVMVDSLLLRHDCNGRLVLCPLCRGVHQFGRECDPGRYGDDLLPPLVVRSQKICPDCGDTFKEDYSTPFFARYEPVAVIGDCAACGLFFARPSAGDLRLIEQANNLRAGLVTELPDWFQVADGPKSSALVRRGIRSYLDLYSSRQLLYIASATHHLRQMPADIRLKLALLVSTSLEFNAMLCGYKGAVRRRPGAVRHVFSRHAYTFPYTALENNPVAENGASGTLYSLFNQRIRRASRWAARPFDIGLGTSKKATVIGETATGREVFDASRLTQGSRQFLLHHGSAAALPLPNSSVDHVVTDPPYMDYVQYGDLAAFFLGFLRAFLDSTGGVNWAYDPDESVAVSSKDDYLFFADTMGAIFSECCRVLKPDGRLVFTYHHWRPEAWAALSIALKRAGFGLVAHYAVRSEGAISVHINGLCSIVHDTILVLAAGYQQQGMVAPGQPSLVDCSDSERFCDDCGRVLGWVLRAEIPEGQALDIWKQVLGG